MRLDRWEAAVLALLFALSVSVLAGLLLRVWLKGGVVTGGDGYLVADALQYLNWGRQSGEFGASANLYDLADGPRSFVHPGLLLVGLANALGLGVAASYLIFKPLAVGVLFAGALFYVRRFFTRPRDRRFALLLAVLTCLPTAALVGWSGLGGVRGKFEFDLITGELWAGSYLWGYLFTAVAVGLVPLGLLAYEKGGRWLWAAAACGLFAAWLQPWQGATFAIVLVGAEVLTRRRDVLSAWPRALPVLVATALPLVYYFLLSRLDPAWELAGKANTPDAFGGRFWLAIVLGLALLTIPAAFAYRKVSDQAGTRRPGSSESPGSESSGCELGPIALRVWPLAALLVYALPLGTFPYHALQGLTLPLVVLVVLAWRARLGERPLPLAAAAMIAVLLIVPGTAYRIGEMQDAVAKGFQPHFLQVDERDALRGLERDPRAGGVLTPVYMGLLVPAYTGRETYIGAGSWTPNFDRRREQAEALFSGRLSPAAAERLVRSSGARFLLSDCQARADISRVVAGFTEPPRRFGCATVWRVR